MYLGCPVFGSRRDSLPELVIKETGFLSKDEDYPVKAIKNSDSYYKNLYQTILGDVFNSKNMALKYLKKCETVLPGRDLNDKAPVCL